MPTVSFHLHILPSFQHCLCAHVPCREIRINFLSFFAQQLTLTHAIDRSTHLDSCVDRGPSSESTFWRLARPRPADRRSRRGSVAILLFACVPSRSQLTSREVQLKKKNVLRAFVNDRRHHHRRHVSIETHFLRNPLARLPWSATGSRPSPA